MLDCEPSSHVSEDDLFGKISWDKSSRRVALAVKRALLSDVSRGDPADQRSLGKSHRDTLSGASVLDHTKYHYLLPILVY